ncbi:MAG: ABC transporter substrate-binding protein [Candidatus Lambdaproteobacteria bacterium]|nr:ABC transporter substrate-binding protein [Candidatus Lambdaproteobacteria bacterium]
MRRSNPWAALLMAAVAFTFGSATALAQKYGGVLRTFIDSNPPSLSIHESTWPTTSFPMDPVYNNLVWFDPFTVKESLDSLQPDLAESWVWGNGGKHLTLKLREGVHWHDGRPFTSKDVKHTFDNVRGAVRSGFKLIPRQPWFANVAEIVTRGDHEVTFQLKRPQPSLLAMLAAGWSVVYPAHVSPAELRITAMGTGPFRLSRYERDKVIEIARNTDYYVKGRPYLDGIQFYILKARGTQNAALIGKQMDAAYPSQTTRPVYEQLKAANVGLAFIEKVANGTLNVLVNAKRPPFNDLRLRQAVNLAMDRNSVIRSVYQGGARPGSSLIPAPEGVWGLTPEQIQTLPGYGDPAANKAESRRLLAEAGFGPENPLRVIVSTRGSDAYVQPAVWAVAELKAVGIVSEVKQIDPINWANLLSRRDYQLAINATAVAIDDPDAAFYENFSCGSIRNYSDYCNPELQQKFDEQSMQTDFATRHKLVQEIDVQLQRDVARPYLAYRVYFYAHFPYVKNWIPHVSTYNAWRMADVWLDK